ncbi:hypothetical protein HK103_003584 [Boothiomyces macroporosus]|uniref:Uncharacterized protein n=1 Tax=Boothiomyces macroporosus TaxID=261099 RepID=A0AAD5UKK4_9FUNG|nr:hypothetical protein HK103_003584 [Boothiomyces macroporosus]
MPLYYFNPAEYAPSPYELYQEQLRAGRYRQMQEQMYQERLRQAYLERLYEQKLQERLEQIYRQKAQEELEQLVEARVNQQLAQMGLYQPARQPVRQAVQPTDIYYYPQERKQPEYQVYLRSGQTTPTRSQPTHIPIEAKQEVPKPVKQEPQYVKIFVQSPQESQKECCEPKEKAKCCKARCDSKYKCQKAKSARKASERNVDAVKSSINSVFDVIEHLMNQTQESQQKQESQESQKQEQQQPKQTSKPIKIHIEDKNEEPLSMIEKLRRNSEVLLEPKESLNEVASDAETHEDIKDDASDTSNLSMIERLKVKSEAILEQKQDAAPKEPEIPVEEIQIADVPDTKDTLAVEDQSAKVAETVTATEPQAESNDNSEKKVEPEHVEIQKPIEKHGSKDTLMEENMEDLHIHSPRSTTSDTFEMVANV